MYDWLRQSVLTWLLARYLDDVQDKMSLGNEAEYSGDSLKQPGSAWLQEPQKRGGVSHVVW